MKSVDEKDGDEESEHHRELPECQISRAINQRQRHKQQRRGDFHHQMMPMDFGPTIFTTPLLNDVSIDGDVLRSGKLGSTRTTVGRRFDDGFSLRNAVYHHIKKAAQSGAKDSYQNVYHEIQKMLTTLRTRDDFQLTRVSKPGSRALPA